MLINIVPFFVYLCVIDRWAARFARDGWTRLVVLGAELDSFAAIVAPCNPKGYKMVPDRGACEALFRLGLDRFWASEMTAGACVPLVTAAAHVLGLGLRGGVLDSIALQPGRELSPISTTFRTKEAAEDRVVLGGKKP